MPSPTPLRIRTANEFVEFRQVGIIDVPLWANVQRHADGICCRITASSQGSTGYVKVLWLLRVLLVGLKGEVVISG